MVQRLKNGKYNPIVPVIHGWGYVPMVNDDGSLIKCDTEEEAEQMGYDLDVMAEWNGNSVFSDDAKWNADGTPFDINAELIDGEEENDDEEDNLLF